MMALVLKDVSKPFLIVISLPDGRVGGHLEMPAIVWSSLIGHDPDAIHWGHVVEAASA